MILSVNIAPDMCLPSGFLIMAKKLGLDYWAVASNEPPIKAGLALSEQPVMAQLGYGATFSKNQMGLNKRESYDRKSKKNDPWRHHGPKIQMLKERAEREARMQQLRAAAKTAHSGSTTSTTTTTKSTVTATTTTTTTTTTMFQKRSSQLPAFHSASAHSAGVSCCFR